MSLVTGFRDSLQRTAAHWADRFSAVLGSGDSGVRSGLEAETLESLEELLLEADVGVKATERIVGNLRLASLAADTSKNWQDALKKEIRNLFLETEINESNTGRPRVVLVVGVNGTGKTTTVGKLANLMKAKGEQTIICAADTFRAAAVEQLAVWAGRAGVRLIKATTGKDPASVIFDAIKFGKTHASDVVIVDTAGRLHTRTNLMNELDKMRRVVAREVEGAPHEVLLVLDATVGQNGLMQARQFLESVGVTGVVLTKLDGTAKGGIAVAIAAELRLPIRYVGVGEGLQDLLPFCAEEYVDGLFLREW